jgi:AraC-like DNA-binding protein
MLLLDTDSLPATQRAEAFQAQVSQNSSTSIATFDDPTTVHARLHLFDFGPGRVFNVEASGNTLRRTPKLARDMNECKIALAVPLNSSNHMGWQRNERFLTPHDLLLVDMASPYVYGWHGNGGSYAFQVDLHQLDVPIDTIHAAAIHLHESPLYSLVRDHIIRLTSTAPHLATDPAANQLGVATIELMRALIISAARDESRHSDTNERSLTAHIHAYIRHHVTAPGLTPARIAAAHNMSVRTLYKLYESQQRSLEQEIIEQRLAGARTDLATNSGRYRSIAATAQAWGFTNPSHFTNRFRQAYGTTPRQWRANTAPPPRPTPESG